MENFTSEWKSRFPGSEPPPNLIQCLKSGDLAEYQQALEKSCIQIKELEKEILHQEFISSHLQKLIEEEKSDKCDQNKFSPDDPLDREVPLLSSTDTLSSDHSYTDITYDNVNSLNSPEEGHYENQPNAKYDAVKSDLKPPPQKPVPAPRHSAKLSFNLPKDRSSVYVMQNNDRQNEEINLSNDKKVARGGSLDSSYTRSGKKGPVPPAKPTGNSIKKFRIDASSEQIVRSASSTFSHKGSNASLNKSLSEESCVEIAISPKPDANISPGYDKPAVSMSTFKPASIMTKPTSSNFSPKLQRRASPVPSVPNNSSRKSPSSFKKPNKVNQESESIYDEPIPVNENQVEDDVSSSDEEPVYYNLMLLKKKQQSIDSRMTYYGSLDIHKQRLERDAKKLSCRFSFQPDIHSKNMKAVKPPLMRPLKTTSRPKTFVRGVTEEESTTDQDVNTIEEDKCDSMDSAGDSLSSTGDRSGSVDSLASGGSTADEHAWRKRQSLLMATAEDSAYSDDMGMDMLSCPETEKLQMRKWVATSILDSEQTYVSMLDVLQQYRNSFIAAEKTSQSVISEDDTETIFYGIPELHGIHLEFITELKPLVSKWTLNTQVAGLFDKLAKAEFKLARNYLNNYHKAIACIHRCSQDQRFHDLTQMIKVVGAKEAPTLEELLHKPVVRFQRNTLVLHDLINCTPTSHPDYDLLQKTLKIAQDFLDNFQAPQGEREHGESSRYLARYSPIVEKVGNHRKLRHILLFNDLIVCSKQKISGRSKVHHEPKWAIPLLDLTLDDKVTDDEKIAQSHRENIESMQRKVAELQGELRKEMKKLKHSNEGQRSWSIRSHNKNIEKLRKKVLDQEAALVLQSPHLVFRLKNGKTCKASTFLLSSDYERTNWKDTIAGLKGKVSGTVPISSIDLNQLINTVKLPKVAAGSLLDDSLLMEDEHLFGILHVTIHRLHGLKTKTDTYVCLELDSFSHFFMKAKTRINRGNKDPMWNEAFELDLEGAQTLRMLCYAAVPGADKLLGKCALELSKAWLRGDFQEKTVPFNDEMSVSVSLRYASRDHNMRRRISTVKGGVFGQQIEKVTSHEGSDIPLVVKACVQEVEARGLDELGIYRVSGLSSDIDELKKAFDKSSRSAVQLAHDMDIHVLSSLLKLYFRELPEALLTDKAYSGFVQGMNLTDPEAKENYMLKLMKSLPKSNQATAIYMLDHMLKICSYCGENKMTLQNLATVFGPTLLRRSVKNDAPISIEMFTENAKEAMMQTGVLLYLLQLRQGGWDLSTKL